MFPSLPFNLLCCGYVGWWLLLVGFNYDNNN